MEAPRLRPEVAPTQGQAPVLRLLEGKSAAPDARFASLRAWILLFGSLAFSGGHGVFLFTALTRLQKVPGRGELGQGFDLVVLGWFLAAVPLALLTVALRRRFLALTGLASWSVASGVFAATLVAFGCYLHAVALA
jgi:hypothetical protein